MGATGRTEIMVQENFIFEKVIKCNVEIQSLL